MTRTPFKIWQKALMITGVFAVLALSVLAWSVGAGTQLGVTLNLASTAGGLENGLVGHWTFDGKDTINGQINDRSGNGNHGSQVNMATSSAYTQGAIGQAIRTDGTNDYIQFPVSAATDAAADDVYSWSAWVFVASTGPSQIIMSATDNDGRGDANTVFEFSVDGTAANFTASVAANNSGAVNSAVIFNKWTHLAGVKNASRLDFYINGTLVGTDTTVNSAAALTPTTFRIGRPNNNVRHFDGATDDARVYTRALSADEVKQLYQLGATTKVGTTPTPSPQVKGGLNYGLVANYTFDGDDMPSGQVNDASGNGNHGSSVAMSTSTAYVKGAIGQALNFDGSNDYVRVDAAADDFTSDISLSAWVKIPPVCTSTKICSIIGRNVSNFNNNFIFTVGDNVAGTALDNQLAMHDGSSSAFEGDTDTVVADNTWHHVGYSLSGTTGTLYVDGVAKSTHTLNSTRNATDLMSIGQEWDAGPAASDFVIGSIDDVRFYNRAISADEMKQLYQIGATTKVGTTPAPSNQKGGLNFGLAGHWTFDGNHMPSGQVNDISGNSYHGIQVLMSTSTAYVKGRLGQALRFDGVDDRISLTNSVSVRNQSQVSVSLWFNADQLAGGTQVLYEEQTSLAQNQSRFSLRLHTTNKIRFGGRAPDTDGFTTWVDSNTTLSPNTWYHVVGIFNADSDIQTVYINGVAETASVSEPAFDDSAPVIAPRIAARSGADFFPGRIDDVRIYYRALTPDDVKQLYDMGR